MSRYLVISYFYPPMVSARAFRWHAIARHWVEQGHEVDVVCAWLPGMPDRETADAVNVYHVNARWVERLRTTFIRPESARAVRSDQGNVRASGSNPLRRWLKPPLLWFYRQVYIRFYWPDDAFLWYAPAAAKVRELAQAHHYDAIVSVSLYFTGQLVGEQAHKITPEVPWLVDIGDPFSPMEGESINNAFYRGLNHRTEARILSGADAVVVTTAGTKELYARVFPESARKMTIIPPLLSASFAADDQRLVFPADDKIRLIFSGTLYATIRRPDFLLAVFACLLQTSLAARLELHFFGYSTQAEASFTPYQNLLGDKIFLHGTVNRERANRAILEADVLVNIGNTTTYQLPSKVVEYVATGKRIVNLAQVDGDSSAAFFADYPLVLNLRQSTEVEQAAAQLYDFLLQSPAAVQQEALAQYLRAFEVETVAESYRALLRKE